MNSRERLLKTLNHEEPDRIPLDLGGAKACGIALTAYQNLLEYLKKPHQEIQIANLAEQLAVVDEDMCQTLGVDVRPVSTKPPKGEELVIEEDERYYWYRDEWQRVWKMPKEGGFYYDMMEFPLASQDVETYAWPDPKDPFRFQGIREEALFLGESYGVVLQNILGNGFLQMGAQLFGYDNWFMMLAAEPKKVEMFLEKYYDFKVSYWDALLTSAGDALDVVCELDDLGTQSSTWLSLEMYRCLIKPHQERLFSFIKKKADVKIFLHSCGSVYDFIPDLIEVGVDILNPLQVSAAKMDTKVLKKEFGKDLVFWGGGIDTQWVLPKGSVKDVEEEVKRRIHDLAPGGGFVFATVHNIQADVPPENIMAMINTLREHGQY